MAKWLLDVSLVAGGYFLAGRLGQFLAIPPSYATIIWPASGIAFASLLLFGYRVSPGVFLGAILVNGWTPLLNAGNIEAAAAAVVLPASISFGATAQAMLGAYLVQRIVGVPNALLRDREILTFILLGGPVACVVAATWGIASLTVSGAMDFSQIGLNWWTWWVGDVIGVIIFAPIVMISFAEPRSVWRKRQLSVALPLAAAIGFAIAAFVFIQMREHQQTKQRFDVIVSNAERHFQEQIMSELDALQSVESLFESSERIEKPTFTSFTRHLLSRHAGIQAIAWLPLALPEKSDDRDPRDTVTIRDLTNDSEVVEIDAVRYRGIRLSVYNLDSEQTGANSLGNELAQNPILQAAIVGCCNSGQRVATYVSVFHQQLRPNSHLCVIFPVYDRGEAPSSGDRKDRSVSGVLIGMIHIESIVDAAISEADRDVLDITVFDDRLAPGHDVVHVHQQVTSAHKASEVAPFFAHCLTAWATIQVADRNWRCRLAATPTFLFGQANRYTSLFLVCGLSFTSLLSVFLLVLSGRAARVEASELRYLDLYDNAPDMFISVDIATHRVIECNQTLLKTTRFLKTKLVDAHMYDLFAPESREEVQRAFQDFCARGHAEDVELRLLCRDEESVETSMNMSAVRDERGDMVCCRATLRDVTAKRRVEAHVQKQEMELAHVARLSTMGEMAAGLAHEINQPLAAIAAYAQGAAIRLRDGNSDAESLARVVERISADAHRAGEVITRLRGFVKKRVFEKRDIDINDLVREVAQFAAYDLKHRQVRLGLDLGERLPNCRGDAIQIQQVLLNLIHNGCDAMSDLAPAQRVITLRTRFDNLGVIDVDVEDCGKGLPEDLEDQVFDAFFSSKEHGLGMGLAISRTIVELHGGRIWVTPNLEGGASFHFSLPISEGASPHAQRTHSFSR